jgi:hypothetical protein
MNDSLTVTNYKYEQIRWFNTGQSTPEYIKRYMENTRTILGENNCHSVDIFSVTGGTKCGIRLASNNLIEYTRMTIAMFGDAPTPSGHSCIFPICGDRWTQKLWARAARRFLEDKAIDHQYTRCTNNTHEFVFYRKAHLLTLLEAYESETIEDLAGNFYRPSGIVPKFSDLFPRYNKG